jgi:AcrR family transcriptional regulator
MFKSEDGSIARPTAKAEETRRRILAAALDLFQEYGFSETTMREIARRAEVATGAAYYYFPSKEAIIMAFYWQTHTEFDATFRGPLAETRDLADRIRFLIELKLEQFQPYRAFLGALFRSAGIPRPAVALQRSDARHPRAEHRPLSGSLGIGRQLPADLATHLPRLLWMYHMGIILFWIYDRSARQARTRILLEKSSDLIARAIKLSRFRVLKPFRDAVLGLLESVAL